ncbi:hypothetical protein MHYP_G00016150 [Metynnis hypsauchen]
MIVRPRSLLLGLLVIFYLQSCAVGDSGKSPTECCFSFYTRPIRVAHITEYEKTRTDCSTAGVIFTTKKGHSVCVDPGVYWVKQAMGIIDRRFVEVLDSCLQRALVFIISLLFEEGQYYTVKACWSLCEVQIIDHDLIIISVRPRSLFLGLLIIFSYLFCAVEEARTACPRAGVICSD